MNREWDRSIRRAEIGIMGLIIAGVVIVAAVLLSEPRPPAPQAAERPAQPICKLAAVQGKWLTCAP